MVRGHFGRKVARPCAARLSFAMKSPLSPGDSCAGTEAGIVRTWPNEAAPFINELTAADLDLGLDEPLGPVLLAVHGPACAASQVMLDAIIALSWIYRRYARFAILDLRAVPEAALRLGITKVPSLLLFNVSDGVQRWTWRGRDSLQARLVSLIEHGDKDARSSLEALGVGGGSARLILIPNGTEPDSMKFA